MVTIGKLRNILITYINIHLAVKLVGDDQLMSDLDPEWLHWVLCSVVKGAHFIYSIHPKHSRMRDKESHRLTAVKSLHKVIRILEISIE